jgi:hypothetical protein
LDAGLPIMPTYTLRQDTWIGRYEFQAGDEVRWIAWPTAIMDAANHPARQVEIYYGEHRDHPKLEERGPWCWFRGVYLPKLEPVKRPGYVAKDGAFIPMGEPSFEAGVASETQRVKGNVVVGPKELPPYAAPKHKHLFSGMRGTGVGRAKPLPNRE